MAKILIVDDSPTVLQMVSSALRDGGYDVVTAANGEEGLRKAVEERPHLVLLDVMMPGLNGYEVIRKLRQVSQVSVIMVTAKEEKYLGGLFSLERISGWVEKPFEMSILLDKVASTLGEPRKAAPSSPQSAA